MSTIQQVIQSKLGNATLDKLNTPQSDNGSLDAFLIYLIRDGSLTLTQHLKIESQVGIHKLDIWRRGKAGVTARK